MALSPLLDVLSSCWVLRAQAGTWYALSEPYQARDNDTDGSAVAHDSREERAGASTQLPQPRTTYTQMIEHMIPMAGGREGPPPSLSRGGEFSDWVYTIPTAKYDRKEVGSSRSSLTAQKYHDSYTWHCRNSENSSSIGCTNIPIFGQSAEKQVDDLFNDLISWQAFVVGSLLSSWRSVPGDAA